MNKYFHHIHIAKHNRKSMDEGSTELVAVESRKGRYIQHGMSFG